MTKTWSGVARRIRVPQAFAFAVVYLWLAHPTWLSIAIGAVIALAGVALRALASGHINKDSELTTSGPYAHTRNPLYLGSILIAAGFAVAARSPWVVLVIVVVFAAIYVPVIRAEEDFLRTRFPAFDAYAQHVPRFFPRLRPHQSPSGSFCWQRYRHHREYNALIGTAAMMAALAAKLLWPQR